MGRKENITNDKSLEQNRDSTEKDKPKEQGGECSGTSESSEDENVDNEENEDQPRGTKNDGENDNDKGNQVYIKHSKKDNSNKVDILIADKGKDLHLKNRIQKRTNVKNVKQKEQGTEKEQNNSNTETSESSEDESMDNDEESEDENLCTPFIKNFLSQRKHEIKLVGQEGDSDKESDDDGKNEDAVKQITNLAQGIKRKSMESVSSDEEESEDSESEDGESEDEEKEDDSKCDKKKDGLSKERNCK